MKNRSPLPILIPILLTGAFLRLWQLTAIPPGLHYDLAANGLLTNSIAFDGWRPVFITGFTGKEALFFYSAALIFRLLGPSIFALRLTAAFWGILAIPATYFALRQIDPRRPGSHWTATFGAALMATLFMHLVWSRFGFRVITQPVIQSLALGFLFRGLRQHDRRALALGGAFTGLAAYTYLAARLFPVPLAVALFVLLIATLRQPAERRQLKQRLGQVAIYLLAAALIFAPLGWFFIQNPDTFFTRIAQVAPRAGENNLIVRGLTGSLGMLFLAGEPYDRFNIPGRPIFDPLQAVLFLVGLAVTLRHLFQRKSPVDWAAEALLLAWIPAMLLPTALAVHEIFPSNVRAFGLLPVLLIFPARGLLALLRWITRRTQAIPAHRWPAIATLGLLAAGFAITGYDYFGRWAQQPGLPTANDADLVAAAAFLDTQPLDSTTVYMSSIHYRHPTLAFLSANYAAIHWNTGGDSLTIPASGAALYIFPQSGALPPEWLAGWGAFQIAAQPTSGGFDAYRFGQPDQIPLPGLPPLAVNFSNLVQLEGAAAYPADDSSHVTLDLRWHVLNLPPEGDFQPYVRLVDSWGYTWAQAEKFSYPSEQWQVGDTIFTRLVIDVPPGTPPGEYQLRVGMFAASTNTNLTVTAPDGRYAGQRTTAATITLSAPPAGDVDAFLNEQLGLIDLRPTATSSGLQLLGYLPLPATLRQGETFDLTLFWQAGQIPLDSHQLDITLGGTNWREHPAHDTLPFDHWQPGQLLLDRHTLHLPHDAPPGETSLRLTVDDLNLELGTIEVQAVPRQFQRPGGFTLPDDPPTFGDAITLAGYTTHIDGGTLTLELLWQAITPLDHNYTVFVHLLDPGGTLIQQRDTWPQNGTYGTALWAAGEYIRDPHTFTLPPGNYQIAIGLYLPETGQHLPLPNGNDRSTLTPITIP